MTVARRSSKPDFVPVMLVYPTYVDVLRQVFNVKGCTSLRWAERFTQNSQVNGYDVTMLINQLKEMKNRPKTTATSQ